MNHKIARRLTSIILIIFIAVSVLPYEAAAAVGLSNFSKKAVYHEGQFSDVPANAWYRSHLQYAVELGLVSGKTASTFAPNNNITFGEVINLASKLHEIYYTGKIVSRQGSPWYQPSVDYAKQNGLIDSDYSDYGAYALRSDIAVLFSKALPQEVLTPISIVEDDAIPDVKLSYSYGPAVYLLYRAGVFSGVDSSGKYLPNKMITRADIVAILSLMVNVSQRTSVTLKASDVAGTKTTPADGTLSAEEIAKICSPAVVYIEMTDRRGDMYSGSGFFIDSDGTLVTCYHVLDGAARATVKTTGGKTYTIDGFYDYDKINDWAVVKVRGSGFPTLSLGGSGDFATGSTVYAIGSPLGLENTFTQGIVSNVKRTVEGVDYIQTNAQISSGSSGGALLNKNGLVIGITAASFVDGQNLNLAVPASKLSGYNKGNVIPFTGNSASTQPSPPPSQSKGGLYPGWDIIPDLGAANGYPLSDQASVDYINDGYTTSFFYDFSTQNEAVSAITKFENTLIANGFNSVYDRDLGKYFEKTVSGMYALVSLDYDEYLYLPGYFVQVFIYETD